MRYSFFLAALALAMVPRVATAQRADTAYTLAAGARVRVWSSTERLAGGVGTIVERDGDTITFRPDHCVEPCNPMRLGLEVLDRIDVRTGASPVEGAVIGGAIGLGTGLVLASLVPQTSQKCADGSEYADLNCIGEGLGNAFEKFFLVALPTVLGVAVGKSVGAGSAWRRLPLGVPAPRVSIAPSSGGGMTVGIRLPLDLAAPVRR